MLLKREENGVCGEDCDTNSKMVDQRLRRQTPRGERKCTWGRLETDWQEDQPPSFALPTCLPFELSPQQTLPLPLPWTLATSTTGERLSRQHSYASSPSGTEEHYCRSGRKGRLIPCWRNKQGCEICEIKPLVEAGNKCHSRKHEIKRTIPKQAPAVLTQHVAPAEASVLDLDPACGCQQWNHAPPVGGWSSVKLICGLFSRAIQMGKSFMDS